MGFFRSINQPILPSSLHLKRNAAERLRDGKHYTSPNQRIDTNKKKLRNHHDRQTHQKNQNGATSRDPVGKRAHPTPSALQSKSTSMLVLHPCIDTITPWFPSNVKEWIVFSVIGWFKMFPIRFLWQTGDLATSSQLHHNRGCRLSHSLQKNISFSQNNTNKGRGTDPAVCVAIWMEEPLHLSNGMKGRWTLRVWKHNILMHRSREVFKKGYDTPIIDLWHARLRRTNEICAQNNRIYFYFHRLNGVVERCNRIVRCCSVYPPPTTSHSVGNYILMVVRGDRL